jgi:hypothetical protein
VQGGVPHLAQAWASSGAKQGLALRTVAQPLQFLPWQQEQLKSQITHWILCSEETGKRRCMNQSNLSPLHAPIDAHAHVQAHILCLCCLASVPIQ